MTFQPTSSETTSKAELYSQLALQVRSLLGSERDFMANAANFSSLLYHTLPASNSEIVVPLSRNGRLIGVLDLDSPVLARFDDEDAQGLNDLAIIFTERTDLP